MSDAHHAYDQREEALGSDTMREVERRVVLSVLDRKWREHLYEMDYLQEGIGLRAMAQRDPLIEYQREGFQLFEAMMEAIKEESVSHLFSVEVQVAQPAAPAVGAAPMSVGDLVGGLADRGPRGRRRDRCRRAASPTRTRRPTAAGRRPFGSGVRVSGVDLDTEASARRPCATPPPARTAAPSRPSGQQTVERKADRRGKKVKRKRR